MNEAGSRWPPVPGIDSAGAAVSGCESMSTNGHGIKNGTCSVGPIWDIPVIGSVSPKPTFSMNIASSPGLDFLWKEMEVLQCPRCKGTSHLLGDRIIHDTLCPQEWQAYV